MNFGLRMASFALHVRIFLQTRFCIEDWPDDIRTDPDFARDVSGLTLPDVTEYLPVYPRTTVSVRRLRPPSGLTVHPQKLLPARPSVFGLSFVELAFLTKHRASGEFGSEGMFHPKISRHSAGARVAESSRRRARYRRCQELERAPVA